MQFLTKQEQRHNYAHGEKEKCVVNPQALIQELTGIKDTMCSQKIGSEEGLMTIGAKKWFSPQNKERLWQHIKCLQNLQDPATQVFSRENNKPFSI